MTSCFLIRQKQRGGIKYFSRKGTLLGIRKFTVLGTFQAEEITTAAKMFLSQDDVLLMLHDNTTQLSPVTMKGLKEPT